MIFNLQLISRVVKWFSACFGLMILFQTGALKAKNAIPESKITVNDSTEHCSLKIGWGIWPPYQYLSESGEAQGIQIRLLNDIAKQAGCQFEYIQQPFSQNIQGIKSGKIDMMADSTITATRQNFAYFSAPYRSEIMILYVRSEKLETCQDLSLTELLDKGFKLGLTQGNLYGEEVGKLQQDIRYQDNIIYLKENRESVTAILNNRIDGYFEDPAVQAYELKRNGLGGQVVSCRIEIYAGKVSFMFSKKSVDLKTVERINRALLEIKKSEHYINNWEW